MKFERRKSGVLVPVGTRPLCIGAGSPGFFAAADGGGGASYSSWDVSGLPVNDTTASESNYRLTKASGTQSTPVYHPVTRSTGKYALRFLVNGSGGGAPTSAVGILNGSIGAYLGASADGIGFWAERAGGSEGHFRNGAFTDYGNLADFSTAIEVLLEVDFTAGKVWFGAAGAFVSGGNPAAGTGETLTIPTSTAFQLVVDMFYPGSVKLLRPFEFTTPASSGFTSGWPD